MLSGPWVNLGAVYEALGDNDAAQQAYKKAIDANPNNCAAYVDLGVLSRRAGDFLSAEANYLACTQRVPNFREAYLNLGILYELYLGRLDDALKAYQTYQTSVGDPRHARCGVGIRSRTPFRRKRIMSAMRANRRVDLRARDQRRRASPNRIRSRAATSASTRR